MREPVEGLISFVIPCYCSSKTIGKVIDEIIDVMQQKAKHTYEVIAVNDASRDNVLDVLKEIAKNNTNIKVLDLAINSGQHAAIMAGISFARGDYIVLLDDDCQCPTYNLWELLKPLMEGFDVSYAKYGYKKESFFRNLGSWINDFMCQILLNKPKKLQLSNFIAFKHFIAEKILEYKNPYPYVDGLLLRSSGKIANVEMEDRARAEGRSTYTLAKLIALFVNGFTAFSVKPLRLATYLGITCSFAGFVYMIYIIFSRLIRNDIDAGYSSLMSVNLFIGGMILFTLGIIGEYIGRMYICLNNSPQYVLRKTYNIGEDNECNKDA